MLKSLIISLVLLMVVSCSAKESSAKKESKTETTTSKVVETGKAQTTCPVMEGNPINKDLYVDVKGKRIYICCGGCVAPIKNDPDKYIAKMEAEGIVLENTPE